jgi:hypothetical protein
MTHSPIRRSTLEDVLSRRLSSLEKEIHTMTPAPLDQTKMHVFADQMLGILNHGALALMTSIGHRTGLFDVMATLPRSTSAQVALAAGLHERYVREWLGAMVTGHIVDYNPATQTYALPPEHAR